MTEIVFETHSLSEDNGRGVATGWNAGGLSADGRRLAAELGERRRDDGIVAVFTSDLGRAVETAEIAFGATSTPILHDWRLRECDYGALNGAPTAEVHEGPAGRDWTVRYPGGESWAEALARTGAFVDDLLPRWADARILVIGHMATLWGFEHRINRTPLDEVRAATDPWREGWEFRWVASGQWTSRSS